MGPLNKKPKLPETQIIKMVNRKRIEKHYRRRPFGTIIENNKSLRKKRNLKVFVLVKEKRENKLFMHWTVVRQKCPTSTLS